MDFNPQSYTPDGTAVFATDQQLLVKFFVHPELSHYKSKAQGKPVHDDVVMISVIQPGEKEEVKVKAEEWHKVRFAKQWEAFEKGHNQQISGTRLEFLFPSEPSTILTLQSFNVFTVEQLGSLTDTAMTNIPMGRQLSQRAKDYLRTANGGAAFHQMEAMQKQIEELKAQLAEQSAAPSPAEDSTPVRRGPGRPPKAQGEN